MSDKKRLQELAGIEPDKPLLSESRSYEVCNAHKSYQTNCKSCQKRKAMVESMSKATGASDSFRSRFGTKMKRRPFLK